MLKHDGQLHCVLYQRPGFCTLVHTRIPPNSHPFVYSIEICKNEISQNFLVFPQISETSIFRFRIP